MKERYDNITLLTNFQLKRARTILRAWEVLDDTVAEAIKKLRIYVVEAGMQLII